MTPLLFNLADRLKQQFSTIAEDRERIRCTGELVDRTFQVLDKHGAINRADNRTAGYSSDKTNPPLREDARSGTQGYA